VWLVDRHAADQLLGVASVSLAPLLSEPYLVRAGGNPTPLFRVSQHQLHRTVSDTNS
jgi:hypothetical protein